MRFKDRAAELNQTYSRLRSLLVHSGPSWHFPVDRPVKTELTRALPRPADGQEHPEDKIQNKSLRRENITQASCYHGNIFIEIVVSIKQTKVMETRTETSK